MDIIVLRGLSLGFSTFDSKCISAAGIAGVLLRSELVYG
jgi:hypothetical protein